MREITSVPEELRKKFLPVGNFVIAYDSTNKVVVGMTTEAEKVEAWTYDPTADKWTRLPTPGRTPTLKRFGPGYGREALMYDPIHKVFFLIVRGRSGDPFGSVETWAWRYRKAQAPTSRSE